MAAPIRRRRTLHLPITLSVALLTANLALMVAWIIVLSGTAQYTALTLGTVLFALVLAASTAYLVLSIKAVRLHARQVNFVDSVTHELKTPLAAAKLYVDTLKLRPDLTPEQRMDCVEVASVELDRLECLITQLLEVGRLERLGTGVEMEDVDLRPLLARCMRNAAAHHHVDPEEVFTADVPATVVRGRVMVLETIFGNLLDNAVKYGGAGGDTPRVELTVTHQGGRVTATIADDGAGVPPDMRTKIFDLFYRGGNELERTRRGTGLGLYIVRTLVTLVGGRVRVYDRARGTGSVFEVDLPADHADSAAAAGGPADRPAAGVHHPEARAA